MVKRTIPIYRVLRQRRPVALVVHATQRPWGMTYPSDDVRALNREVSPSTRALARFMIGAAIVAAVVLSLSAHAAASEPLAADTGTTATGAAGSTTATASTADAAATMAGSSVSSSTTSSKDGTLDVLLCDNKTSVRVAQNTPATRENGQKISDQLMSQWRDKNPQAAKDWMAEENEKHEVPPPADNSNLIGSGQNSTYGEVTPQTVANWQHETYKLAVTGSTIFHSADQLGSEIAVSCDMCHPRAANTHPETYPKFQETLGKVALLRDMINWCIQHPVRGKKLADDDPKMRALEAYILAQRKGVALDYGKH